LSRKGRPFSLFGDACSLSIVSAANRPEGHYV
jgi:hypothetical protein